MVEINYDNKRNAVLGLLILFVLIVGSFLLVDSIFPERPEKNVILLVLDTVRADHVGCCSLERNGTYRAGGLTPSLDSLARHGTAFQACQAQARWTLPAFASIFTGVSSRAHRVNTGPSHMTGIAPEYITIPEMLAEAGYDTYGLFNAPVVDAPYGFHEGYDFIDARGCTLAVDAEYVVDRGLSWLDDRENESGFFMSLHFFDAHYPYDPPDEYWEGWGWDKIEFPSSQAMIQACTDSILTSVDYEFLHTLYCAEIHSMDAQIGRFFAELRDRGLAENTIIIVVADHGEEFGEHGNIFHRSFYQEVIHVPLIVAGPGVMDRVVSDPVGQYDILPTLARLLDLECPPYVEGLPLPLAPGDSLHESIPSSGELTGIKPLVAIRTKFITGIWDAGTDSLITFRRPEQDMLSQGNDDGWFLRMAMEYWATPTLLSPMIVPNSEQRSALMKNLGYI